EEAVGLELEIEIHPLPQGPANIPKKCPPLNRAVKKQDVVRKVGAIESDARGQGRVWQRTSLAADARFESMRHDLLQVRIGDKEIGEAARARGAGASQLGWRRRPVRLGIACINGELWEDLPSHAARRVEPDECVIAGERSALLVVQIDLRKVEAAGDVCRQ